MHACMAWRPEVVHALLAVGDSLDINACNDLGDAEEDAPASALTQSRAGPVCGLARFRRPGGGLPSCFPELDEGW